MSTSEGDQTQPLLQPREGVVECQNETLRMEDETSFKQLKSFRVMKSALTMFTSNAKLMFLMIFSTIPFFVFMLFFEIILRKVMVAVPDFMSDPYRLTTISVNVGNGTRGSRFVTTSGRDTNRLEFLFNVLELSVLYLVAYPLVELVSMTTTVQIAAKVYAGEKLGSFKEVFYRKNNIKGVLIARGCVQLLSFLTLLGLSWVVLNSRIFSGNGGMSVYNYLPSSIDVCWYILSTGVYIMIFIALLYKYIDWSAFWNTTMVISVLEEETGLDAFGMTGYYSKHHKPAGFQLMLGFSLLFIVLRLPCLFIYGGSGNSRVAGVTSVVIGLVCLVNLVKWVAFVLYYFDCKQQTMEKNDEEIGKAAKV